MKKRGRKKKVNAIPATKSEATAFVLESIDGNVSHTSSDRHSPVKKTKRGEHQSTHGFPDHQLDIDLSHQQYQVTRRKSPATGSSSAGTSGAMLTGKIHAEKVLEAMGYLCLYEMLPFELCSSHAFGNLIMKCLEGCGGYADDPNHFNVFTKEFASGYVKNMAAEIKVRTAMQMKTTDFAHLMLSEWRPSDDARVETATAAAATTTVDFTHPSGKELVFLAFFAVGLDHKFNPFRRCLHVSSIETYCPQQGKSIATMFAKDEELKKAMERVAFCRSMPQIFAVEPPCCGYQSFAVDHKLHLLESVPTVLQNIVLATINGVRIFGSYCFASDVFATSAASSSVCFQSQRMDKGEYIDSSSAAVTAGLSVADCYGITTEEIASSIVEELPTSLMGHTYRDLMNKLMYLLAHFKQSSKSREVLRRLALEQCSMSTASYERLFIDRLREMTISMGQIYYVLALVEDMMPALRKYILLHKDNDSDFSKLIQLTSLSRYEWSRVRYLTMILKPFAEATAKLEGEPYVVSSLIVPSVFTLIEKIRDFRPVNIGFTDVSYDGFAKKSTAEVMVDDLPEDIEALRDLALKNLLASFGHLFSVPEASWDKEKLQTFNLLWSATILDPRTKSFIVKGSLPQQDFWEIVKAEAANMAGTKKKSKDNGNDFKESSIVLGSDSSHVGEDGADKGTDLWDDLQAKLTSCAQEEMLLSSAKSSLELTKSSNLLEVEVSFFQEEGRIVLRANPLEWWQNMRMKYPFLARLARYVLSIPCKVKVDDNPIRFDGGLVKRGPSQMNMADLCDLLAASMNLRTEKNPHFEAASKHMWSTV
ncbi:unnamed protein product [Peronospora belbahrii]|nr:unnamed protein product [Peronospora belbahrii]